MKLLRLNESEEELILASTTFRFNCSSTVVVLQGTGTRSQADHDLGCPFCPPTDILYQNQGFLLVRVLNQGTSLPDDFLRGSPVGSSRHPKGPNLLDFLSE